MASYYTAMICENGHVVTSSLQTSPEKVAPFCKLCGAKNVISCANCKVHIEGDWHTEGIGMSSTRRMVKIPLFCHSCGQPYPWTDATLEAARAEIKQMALTDADKESLSATLDDLVRETPRTKSAAARYRELAGKAGGEGAKMVQQILVNVLSAAAKKELGLL